MSHCQKLGYKVGDKFIVLEKHSGFNENQVVRLYQDDGSDAPLFIGKNRQYKLADGQGGAYLALSFVKKIGEQEKEMFDMKTQPWFIRVNNKEEFEAAKEWIESKGFRFYFKQEGNTFDPKYKAIGQTIVDGTVVRLLETDFNSRMPQIKLNFKTVVDSVEYPKQETEQQKKVRELQETIEKAQKQIEDIQKGMK